jgi:hypothetical protein
LPSDKKVTVISVACPFSLTLVRHDPTSAAEVRGVGETEGDGLAQAWRRSSLRGSAFVVSDEAEIFQ